VNWSGMRGMAKKGRVTIRGAEPAEGRAKINLQCVPIIYTLYMEFPEETSMTLKGWFAP